MVAIVHKMQLFCLSMIGIIKPQFWITTVSL